MKSKASLHFYPLLLLIFLTLLGSACSVGQVPTRTRVLDTEFNPPNSNPPNNGNPNGPQDPPQDPGDDNPGDGDGDGDDPGGDGDGDNPGGDGDGDAPGGDGDGDAPGGDGDGDGDGDGPGGGGPGAGPFFETDPQILRSDEVIIPLDFHIRKSRIKAVVQTPTGNPPQGGWPVVVILHGSGGLYSDNAPHEISGKFESFANEATSNGAAAVLPSTFRSRHPDFCEDNSSCIEFAPEPFFPNGAPKDRNTAYKRRRLIIGLEDVCATMDYIASREDLNVNKVILTGTSYGGSRVAAYVQRPNFLEQSSLEFQTEHAADLLPLDNVVIPATCRRPKFALPIAAGCGHRGLISTTLNPNAPDKDLYYPVIPTLFEIGDEDDVPNHCAIYVEGGETTDGTREKQANIIKNREGISNADFTYKKRIHSGAPHNLLEDNTAGPLIFEKLRELIGLL